MTKLCSLVCIGSLLAGTQVFGGELTPPGVPEPTMHTLNEIWNRLDEIATSQSVLASRLAELDRQIATGQTSVTTQLLAEMETKQTELEAKLAELDSRGPITLRLPGDVPLTLVRIPGGTFRMGSPSDEPGRGSGEEPLHPVGIANDFYMGMTEVTQAQWEAVMGSWPDDPPNPPEGLGDNYPAYRISWNDIAGPNGFLERLNTFLTTSGQAVAGKPLRLPSEAEWEYACRGGTQTAHSHAATDHDAYMWYAGNSTTTLGAKPVGQKLPNPFGLYDMHGNLTEWCQDWHHDSYAEAPSDGSAWETPPGTTRVMRGGMWDSLADHSRSAYRYHREPDAGHQNYTFRLLRTH